MADAGAASRSGRGKVGPNSVLRRAAAGPLLLVVAALMLGAAVRLAQQAGYLGYLASRATTFDIWGVLAVLEALLCLIAILGAGRALWRRRVLPALGWSLFALPMAFVIEGGRCHTAACRQMGWAALPAKAFEWSVRIRPVTDPNEAGRIASLFLSKAGVSDRPFKEKRIGDHWLVSTTDDRGWPGAHAVRIDTRTARASFVDCPADKIQCGMERPIVSDGRRVFRNDKLGVVATFPAGWPVCALRGDNEPRGFYAVARPATIPCDIVDPSRQFGVEVAPQRKNARSALEALTWPCPPLSAGTARLFTGQGPTFPGKPSVVCEWRDRDDEIQIGVYALAASPSSAFGAPQTLYEGYVASTPDHLAEDVQVFERFLAGVSIGG